MLQAEGRAAAGDQQPGADQAEDDGTGEVGYLGGHRCLLGSVRPGCLVSRHHRSDLRTSAPGRTGEGAREIRGPVPAGGGTVPSMQRARLCPSGTTTPETVPAR
ncbi:hypothetical protein GCM10010345_40380 [Streptomyces canarius]|uniref:Uncharacterized protein n=1 Tax=Streptomyces canarius TaxID=285453 RepID=A0ABQ3CU10_9ACTN|nr:hypothetical protein GCM10010345_40380 [Streptomyces canarius]